MRRISNLACLVLALGSVSMVYATTPVTAAAKSVGYHVVADSTDDATSMEGNSSDMNTMNGGTTEGMTEGTTEGTTDGTTQDMPADDSTATQNQDSDSTDVGTMQNDNNTGLQTQEDDNDE